MRRTALITTLLLCSHLIAQDSRASRVAWNQPVKPFRIIGNIYYVGARGVSAFLIETPAGAILLDGGFRETAPLIEKNVADLGLRMSDVKILLNSHAHYDHCGGLAELKHASGAKLIASAGDSRPAGVHRNLNCLDPVAPLATMEVDRVIGDDESIQLGGSTLTAHITPGHTRGCTTWTMSASESGKTYRLVFYCSTSVAGNRLVGNKAYPNIVADYEKSFATLRKLPCDVFLGPHPEFFHLDEKRRELERGRRDAFVDPAELLRFIDTSEADFRRQLAAQRAAVRGTF